MTIVPEEKVKPILAWLRSLDVFRIRQGLILNGAGRVASTDLPPVVVPEAM